jgi:hypothetical protein
MDTNTSDRPAAARRAPALLLTALVAAALGATAALTLVHLRDGAPPHAAAAPMDAGGTAAAPVAAAAPAQGAAPAAGAERRVLYWYDPIVIFMTWHIWYC